MKSTYWKKIFLNLIANKELLVSKELSKLNIKITTKLVSRLMI